MNAAIGMIGLDAALRNRVYASVDGEFATRAVGAAPHIADQ
jgi:hypothetical protein